METITDRLKSHVEALAGRIGERNVFSPGTLQAAESYLADEWRHLGYLVQRQAYAARGVECANLEVIRTGNRWPEEIILIGAHFDTVSGSPGADDNASGVAALLELSRLFSGAQPQRTVRFVAFANEESPFFAGSKMGSLIYARAARRRSEDIRFMVSLEMLGYYQERPGSQSYPLFLKHFYPDRGNFIAFVSNWRSRQALDGLFRAFRAHSDFPAERLAAPLFVPGVALSDHFSFWRQGYRAIMVTDTAYLRNPWYHTAGDTPDRLDYQAFSRVVQGLYQALLNCAGGEG